MMNMNTVRILVADDHAMIRMGLVLLLNTRSNFKVVGEAENGEDVVKKALSLNPDVVLMDMMMPVVDGVEATRRIRKQVPSARILLLTSVNSSDGIARAIQAGAAGAILKSDDFSGLVAAIQMVADGGTVMTEDVKELLRKDPPAPLLTDRQIEILQSVTHGYSYAAIAKKLGIREGSVKEHITAICNKLGASNRTEAVAIALKKHLLKVEARL
ncbi:MAG: response regulator transcription factor [Kiritimatiellae bacterium]|nr:response regulator transcription factor [Kiritimatiellia bacterium]